MLDALKVLFAIGVVLAHYSFPAPFGEIMGSFGTVGVVVFFLIQGYQSRCEEPNQSQKLLRRAKRNSILFLSSFLLYLSFSLCEASALGLLNEYLLKANDYRTYLRLVLLMDFDLFRCSHFWFLAALLLSYPFLYLIEAHPRIRRWFWMAIPFLLLTKMAVEMYESATLPPEWFDWHASGIFLWGGLPFSLLGNLLAHKEESLQKLNLYLLIAAFLAFEAAFLTTSCLLAGSVDISIVFRIPSGVILFMLVLRYQGKRRFQPLAWYGRYSSVYVYVLHHIFGYSVLDINAYWIAFPAYFLDWVLPLLVVVASLALSFLIGGFVFCYRARKDKRLIR